MPISQAIVKMIHKGGTASTGSLEDQFDYLSKDGEFEIEGPERLGGGVLDEDDLHRLAAAWTLGSGNYDGRNYSEIELTTHIVVSFPRNTPHGPARLAAREWAHRMFGPYSEGPADTARPQTSFDYITSFHTDREHPHMHIVVSRRSTDERSWLKIANRHPHFNYQNMRERMVEIAARHGIEMVAETREERGLGPREMNDVDRRRVERGEPPRLRMGIRFNPESDENFDTLGDGTTPNGLASSRWNPFSAGRPANDDDDDHDFHGGGGHGGGGDGGGGDGAGPSNRPNDGGTGPSIRPRTNGEGSSRDHEQPGPSNRGDGAGPSGYVHDYDGTELRRPAHAQPEAGAQNRDEENRRKRTRDGETAQMREERERAAAASSAEAASAAAAAAGSSEARPEQPEGPFLNLTARQRVTAQRHPMRLRSHGPADGMETDAPQENSSRGTRRARNTGERTHAMRLRGQGPLSPGEHELPDTRAKRRRTGEHTTAEERMDVDQPSRPTRKRDRDVPERTMELRSDTAKRARTEAERQDAAQQEPMRLRSGRTLGDGDPKGSQNKNRDKGPHGSRQR